MAEDGTLRDVLRQTSASLQQQIEEIERQQPALRRADGRSRSPLGRWRGQRELPIGCVEADELFLSSTDTWNSFGGGCGSSAGVEPVTLGAATLPGAPQSAWMGTQSGFAGLLPVMGTGGMPEGLQQQLLMRQQLMMSQLGAMQQLMMGQMLGQQQAYASVMAMMSSGESAAMAAMNPNSPQFDPEEAQRIMGRQAYANAVAAMNRREVQDDDDEEDVAPGPSSNVHHPNYRPPDMEPVMGITDRRFEGRVKLWFEDKGYGFIECSEIKKKFPDVDVFLHQNQRRHFVRGDYVSFNVFLNFRGKPQGTELRRKREKSDDADAGS